MPHIHNQPGQHDMTVSAYIVLHRDNELRCLVHYHKKMDKFLQIGGHIELDETPWQSVAHEIQEESGYTLDQLGVLQILADRVEDVGNVSHPVPFSMNTHNVGDSHYHSDLCYGFLTKYLPKSKPKKDESHDLKWLTIDELKGSFESGDTLEDVYEIYKFLLKNINKFISVPSSNFSLEKPKKIMVSYKRGKPGEG